MKDRPNFLIFVVDQMRADWLGCTGHKVVKTPNIDAIAAKGTIFSDFHVALPVCMPNRASMMTGRMPSLHGVRYNGLPLSRRANTFVDVLAKAGYDTAMIGKSHFQPFTDQAPLQAPDHTERLIAEAWEPDGQSYTQEEPETYAGETETPFEGSYYGFKHVQMVTGHGHRCGGHYAQWFRRKHPDWKELHDPANERPHSYTCPQAFRTPVPESSYPTAWIADKAVDYLRERDETPFCAMVSFPDPHHPFNPPGRYWDMYDPEDFDISLPFEGHQNPPPPLVHARYEWEQGKTPPIPQIGFFAGDREIKEAMALTAGMVTMIDDQVDRVVEALKASGKSDNTVIIFTSDHGDYLGAFNLLLKGPLQHHSITRVPFIWSDCEGAQTANTDALASTIDLSASVLDRAGLEPYWGMQGKSLLNAIQDGTGPRDALLIEHNDGGPRMGLKQPARVRTLRTAKWRLSLYANENWGELYDLSADPNETKNLWEDTSASGVKSDLALQLAEELAKQMDESPRSNRLA
ncbi:MAG: sulfatase-like hydrolase/transferase [Pseudomonadota bacterium]